MADVLADRLASLSSIVNELVKPTTSAPGTKGKHELLFSLIEAENLFAGHTLTIDELKRRRAFLEVDNCMNVFGIQQRSIF